METIQPIPQPPQPSPKNPYKILFFLSLGLFLIVVSVLTTLLITQKSPRSTQTVQTNTKETELIPTETNSESITSIPTEITVTPTKSATTSSITKDWKTYEDKEIGFSFNYPKNITLIKKISNGVFSLSINNSQAFAGGINIITGITINRGGSGLDFGGYTKEGNQISYVFDKDRSVTCTSKTIQKIYKNKNNIEIVILSGLNNPDEDGMLAPCETISDNIQALINTQNKTYPGIAFITSSLITESDLLKILDTFKLN